MSRRSTGRGPSGHPAYSGDTRDFEEGPRDSLRDPPGGERLQKVMAAAGVGSRRHCEDLIGAGRVQVDVEVVRRFGARVDPAAQVIRVDGMRLATAPDKLYYALNKPAKVVSTMSDPQGRRTVADFVDAADRLFHVGRLDYETEGLLLLTNDGELAHRLTHPSYGVLKTYLADVPGPVRGGVGQRLREGVALDDTVVSVDGFRVVETAGNRVLVTVTLHEGSKHVVRRLLAEVGHPVRRLVRTDFGPISLGQLKPGTARALSGREVGELYGAVGL